MHIVSTNFAQTSVWKHEYDVKLWRHKQRSSNTNDHRMPLNETPHKSFLRTTLVVHITHELSNSVYTTALRHVEEFSRHSGWKPVCTCIIASTWQSKSELQHCICRHV